MFGWLKLLNPRNLQKEVDVYGYHFSWKSHISVILFAGAASLALGALFQLTLPRLMVALAAAGILLPILILDMYRKMYEQKRFADAVTYMEQMLYAFQKSGKIITALRETGEIFEDGQMRRTVDEAVAYLERGEAASEEGLFREALGIIETSYQCPKIRVVHELLLNEEEHGGELEQSILILLDDLELWKRRGYRLQAEKKKSHTDNIISILVSVALCAVALYVLDAMKNMFAVQTQIEILQLGVIQTSSLLFLLFSLYIFLKSSRNLTCDWLQAETMHPSDYIRKSYETVVQYNEKKEKRKSLLWAAPALVGLAVALLCRKPVPAVVLLLLSVFLLMQHRVGYRLARKDVTEEIYLALPGWFMELALLLQNNNVQVSIAKSGEGAPPVLAQEIAALQQRLSEAPARLQSYTEFCSRFDVPEAQSCMKMLHAVSEMGTGNVGVQLNNLIVRVNEMQDMAEEIRGERAAFRMKMIFSYPVMAATVKLLADLTVGMAVMFQMLGSMGGV